MSRPIDFEGELNPQQLEAVTHGEGPQLVLAGAGSGKTRVITYRIAWLVRELGIDPASIVAVTFTNKAAGEMRDRVGQLLGTPRMGAFVGTFHRFALVLLRKHGARVGVKPGFAIFDTDDQIRLVKKALEEESLAESSFPPRAVLATISSAKNRLYDPQRYEKEADGFFERRVAKVYATYQQMLVQSSGVDFDDMLRLSVKLLAEHDEIRDRLRDRIHYLLVDEFQDTNHAQMRLVRQLVEQSGNLTAVGDEDQGIYRWRGADLDNVLDFEEHFPGAVVRKLERNYRSTQNILAASGALVANNRRRRAKTLWTDVGDGESIELYKARDDQDEARWIVHSLDDLQHRHRLSDMGILVRTNAQTRAFEEELMRHGMPYVLVGGTRFYERAEIKDLVAYLRVLRNPRDNFSLSRILNRPARSIGRATEELLAAEAEQFGGILWEALVRGDFDRMPTRSGNALRAFRDTMVELIEAAGELPLPALLERLLEATGYAGQFKEDDPEGQARLENIQELLTAAQEFTEQEEWEEADDLLTAFLDHVSLVADIDTWEADRGVSLMTLHSAKGLEFSVVAVAGLEEGVLPHFNASGSEEDLEEERRLLYVGMTRARKKLFLTTCRRRRIAGRYQDQRESPFLLELPHEALEISQSPELFVQPKTSGVYSFYQRKSPASGFDDAPFDPPSRPTASSSGDDIRRGQRVRHPTLGEGVVLSIEGDLTSGKLTVFFDLAGKRRLVAKYANLEVL